jgi:hypothetical protein
MRHYILSQYKLYIMIIEKNKRFRQITEDDSFDPFYQFVGWSLEFLDLNLGKSICIDNILLIFSDSELLESNLQDECLD